MKRMVFLLAFLVCFVAQAASAIGTGEMLKGLAKLGIKPGHSKITTCGAAGSSPTTDALTLQACIDGAGADAIIEFVPGKTYILDRPLFPGGDQTWLGYGVVLKRVDDISSTITATSCGGGACSPVNAVVHGSTNEVTVTSATGFAVGQYVAAYQTATPYGNAANHSSTFVKITGVNGNVITLASTLYLEDSGSLASGTATLAVVGPLVDNHHNPAGGAQVDYDLNMAGFEIDGNRANAGPFASWWTHYAIYAYGTVASAYPGIPGLETPMTSRFTDLYIHDVMSEGIGLSIGGYVTNSRFENIGGNGVHFGQCWGGCFVTDNIFDGCNLYGDDAGDDGPGHEDACIAFSNGNGAITITGNEISHGLSGIGTITRSDNGRVALNSNVILEPRATCWQVDGGAVNETVDAVVIDGNTCIATGGKLAYTSPSGTFTVGEVLTGSTSQATGRIVYVDTGNNEVYLDRVVGAFDVAAETISDGSASATSSPETAEHALILPKMSVTATYPMEGFAGPKSISITDNQFENILGSLNVVSGARLLGNTWRLTHHRENARVSVTSITTAISDSVRLATVTVGSNPAYDGNLVRIYGADLVAGYDYFNGWHRVKRLSSTQFTFPLSPSAPASATGTMQMALKNGDDGYTLMAVSDCQNVTIGDRFEGAEEGVSVAFPQGGPRTGPTESFAYTGNVWFDGSEFINNYRYGIRLSSYLFGRHSGVRNSRFLSSVGRFGGSYCATGARPGFDVLNNSIQMVSSSSGGINAFAGGSWAAGDDGPIIMGNSIRATGSGTIRLANDTHSCLVINNVSTEDESNFDATTGTSTNQMVGMNWQFNPTAHVEPVEPAWTP